MTTETLETLERQHHQSLDLHHMFVDTEQRVRKYNRLRIIGACNRFWMRRGQVDHCKMVGKAARRGTGNFIRNVM